MWNINFNFFLDAGLLLTAIAYIVRISMLRARREDVLSTYKRGTATYGALNRALSTRRLVAGYLVGVLLIVKGIIDGRTIAHKYGDSSLGQMLFLAGMGILLSAVIFYVIYKSRLWQTYGSEKKHKIETGSRE